MNPALKKGTGVLLALSLLTTTPAVAASAVSVPAPKTVTVSFVVSDEDKSDTFQYSDTYFSGSSYQFRKDLALASFALAVSSGASQVARHAGDFTTENRNFRSLIDQCGFERYASSEYARKKPDTNTIGVHIASKTVSDDQGEATLLAVGVRGFGYRNEWAGNGLIGASGDHEGFCLARDQALTFVKDYLRATGTTGRIKVWVSGYSRGGVVSNLIGGALDDGYDLGNNVTLSPDDLYVYCMEPPMGTMREKVRDEKYNNIHNIVNPADIVPYVAFKDWNFARYGVDHTFPGIKDQGYSAQEAKMKEYLKTTPNEIYNIYWPGLFQAYTVRTAGKMIVSVKPNQKDQKTFYDDLSHLLCTSFTTSRQDYADNLQDIVMEILSIYGREDYDFKEALNLFAGKVQNNAKDVFTALIDPSQDAVSLLTDYAVQSLNEANVTQYDRAKIRALLETVVPRLTRMAKADPSTTFTFVANAVNIFTAHTEGTVQSWLRTLPESYLKEHTSYSYNL